MRGDLALVLFGFAHIETCESYRRPMVLRWMAGRFAEPIDTVQPGGWADYLDSPTPSDRAHTEETPSE